MKKIKEEIEEFIASKPEIYNAVMKRRSKEEERRKHERKKGLDARMRDLNFQDKYSISKVNAEINHYHGMVKSGVYTKEQANRLITALEERIQNLEDEHGFTKGDAARKGLHDHQEEYFTNSGELKKSKFRGGARATRRNRRDRRGTRRH